MKKNLKLFIIHKKKNKSYFNKIRVKIIYLNF